MKKLTLIGIVSVVLLSVTAGLVFWTTGANSLSWISNLSIWLQSLGFSLTVADTLATIGLIIAVLLPFIGLWQIVSGSTGPLPKILAYIALGVCVATFMGSAFLGSIGFDGLLKTFGGELSAARQPFETIQNGGTPDFSWYQSWHFGHLLVAGLIGAGLWLTLGTKKG